MAERVPVHNILLKQNEDFEKVFYFPYDFSDHTVAAACKESIADETELFAFTGSVVPQASIAAATLSSLRAILNPDGTASVWATATITGLKIAVLRAVTAWPTLQPVNNLGVYDVYSKPAGGLWKRRVEGVVTFKRNVDQ